MDFKKLKTLQKRIFYEVITFLMKFKMSIETNMKR